MHFLLIFLEIKVETQHFVAEKWTLCKCNCRLLVIIKCVYVLSGRGCQDGGGRGKGAEGS